jgi:hypothetical protein
MLVVAEAEVLQGLQQVVAVLVVAVQVVQTLVMELLELQTQVAVAVLLEPGMVEQ